MTAIPLVPYAKPYRGSKANLQAKAVERARTARRIADHANRKIAQNAAEVQVLMFALLAHEIGVSEDEVRDALSNGGYNGITVRVDADARERLRPYMQGGT